MPWSCLAAARVLVCLADLPVEGAVLVRVLAVTHLLYLFKGQGQLLREGIGAHLLSQIVGDQGVIGSGVLKYLGCQTELGLTAQFTGLEALNDAVIISGVNDHSYILPVLGGSTDHGRAADVDVLDGLLQSDAVLEDGLLEGIEVDGNYINGG